MLSTTTFTIYSKISELPKNWDDVAIANAFLQTPYLKVLETSAPTNMQCFYIGIFENSELIGVALAQYLNLNQLESFGERDKCLKTAVRNFVFKNFASHVLFLGNNMITGQNGYTFNKEIDFEHISRVLVECAEAIIGYFKKNRINIHLVSFKDFYPYCADALKRFDFKNIYEFNTQPNMIFRLSDDWKTKDDYVAAFSKKYRDQYKRARKKCDRVLTKELSLEEITANEERIYELYHHVAKNAPFNTFFLAKNHFSTFKKQLNEQFVLVGYFMEEKLVGFHTLLLNGTVLETYFLGYDSEIQKEKMLYLNMLYNMTEFGIEKGYKKIIFGRTALEIKSSVGAEPVRMSGFIYHRNGLINQYIGKIFTNLEPEAQWQQRHPFK
ncbi:8-amino-7-oxononanoate synthase [Flavobacterium suncheonense GH29-5 = DSM 17707]|uniref:8-amino-7-oxononanoate synthase n=1 Tax=Flavobacterium suncheonense GH29-5 = DSM 17707 TaxID=1121899 RepID=A0A0A2MBP7_9FLAO|nr:GNAT family N-acetyltransferase [Flavobacterium suncheonense]KGO88893.1 8-amino-7-oxononanoate synthase [Flavobacterium suncheonense GH29-5 = DSM 17707]